MIIIDHNHPVYQARMDAIGKQRWNGAVYYSEEILRNFIPNIKTDRNWITVNVPFYGADHSIVFMHNNKGTHRYNWLTEYKDLIMVCGIPKSVKKVEHLGKAIYLPLSVDIAEVEKYKRRKTKEVCFAGRKPKRKMYDFPKYVDMLESMPREELLHEMAAYRNVYAVGRTAIEAKILGCNVLPYDIRFPDPSFWKVVDNMEAADMLQKKLDEIDGGD